MMGAKNHIVMPDADRRSVVNALVGAWSALLGSVAWPLAWPYSWAMPKRSLGTLWPNCEGRRCLGRRIGCLRFANFSSRRRECCR